eukprot:TRINITY_DN11102_c0_g1_i11.p2 TRINITY_DN11102_c0_g1~~TRINITY_DN11102_c0_g1_i11.p2  ORF type:complete len:269 (+),score=58.78 TRINITY_DN11102_c0_g1_i11:1456-2262(+)
MFAAVTDGNCRTAGDEFLNNSIDTDPILRYIPAIDAEIELFDPRPQRSFITNTLPWNFPLDNVSAPLQTLPYKGAFSPDGLWLWGWSSLETMEVVPRSPADICAEAAANPSGVTFYLCTQAAIDGYGVIAGFILDTGVIRHPNELDTDRTILAAADADQIALPIPYGAILFVEGRYLEYIRSHIITRRVTRATLRRRTANGRGLTVSTLNDRVDYTFRSTQSPRRFKLRSSSLDSRNRVKSEVFRSSSSVILELNEALQVDPDEITVV